MKKEITYERLSEIPCETGERVPASYKTLEMDAPEEYEGVFKKYPSNGGIYIDIETPLEPAMEGVEKAFDSFSKSAYNAIKRTKIKKK